MTDKTIAEDAATLQPAGSGTSCSVIDTLCHYSAAYTELQIRIRREGLEAFVDEDPHKHDHTSMQRRKKF